MIHPDLLFGRLGNRMFQMAYIYAQMKKGNISDIYVQDPKYFEGCKQELRVLFGDHIGNIDKVAIHVRRGDYVGNSFYVDLSKTNYYKDAMALFPGKSFMVFSDDIEWCKKQDVFKGCSFSERHDEVRDLNIMAACKGIIMANSSYSWWAAYLSKAEKIIAPKAWYTDGVERTVCPKEWIKL
jgi:hypothetical protein